MAIEEGVKAPNFCLEDQEGNKVSLEDFKEKKIALYFYSKDNTPGCTRQACSFAENYLKLKALNVEVIGISKDLPASHTKFKEKYNLPFTLLCDPEHQASEAFGVWVLKKMYGKENYSTLRSCFLIDENGVIIKRWLRLKPELNASLVLEFLGAQN